MYWFSLLALIPLLITLIDGGDHSRPPQQPQKSKPIVITEKPKTDTKIELIYAPIVNQPHESVDVPEPNMNIAWFLVVLAIGSNKLLKR